MTNQRQRAARGRGASSYVGGSDVNPYREESPSWWAWKAGWDQAWRNDCASQNTAEKLMGRLLEATDFLRACSQAGGSHENAYNLHVDLNVLTKSCEKLEAINENIMRELEGRN